MRVILSRDNALRQVTELLTKYTELKITESSDAFIRLEGAILVHRSVNDYTLRKKYYLEIVIPVESEQLPYVVDSGKSINESYPHRYSNGTLCLETEAAIRWRFANGFDLVSWMNEFVEPYFLSYEYYMLYGAFPFGERCHGITGIIESYQDILHTEDLLQTINVAEYVRNHPYRGHLPCPCGSGKRIRKCHGSYMLPFYNNKSLMKQLEVDLFHLEESIREYKREENLRKTK